MLLHGSTKEIETIFKHPQPLSSFKMKTEMAYHLGLLSKDEKRIYNQIGEIRNSLSHEIVGDINDSPKITSQVKTLANNLSTIINYEPKPKIEAMNVRDIGSYASKVMLIRLVTRMVYVPIVRKDALSSHVTPRSLVDDLTIFTRNRSTRANQYASQLHKAVDDLESDTPNIALVAKARKKLDRYLSSEKTIDDYFLLLETLLKG